VSSLGRFSIYFAIVALLTALVPAAGMLSMMLEAGKHQSLAAQGHGYLYLIWIGHTAFYAIAIVLLAFTLWRDRKQS
jgi:hypothetical protein